MQWGDEGKGHIVDMLAGDVDIVARFSGGDNAGHTVVVGKDIFKLHLIPSGIVREQAVCVLGNGMVINPDVLVKEIEGLKKRGIDVSPERLVLSSSAHLITDAHIEIDRAKEYLRGTDPIGTTLRGVGPAYMDKAARTGIRVGALSYPDDLYNIVYDHTAAKNDQLVNLYYQEPLDAMQVATQFLKHSYDLQSYIKDASSFLWDALHENKKILAEGSQGAFLDLDHGTYPYVTSSWTTSSGALSGLGINIQHVNKVIGVAKAFSTRIGSGPFPCEVAGETAERLRGTGANLWDEFGTTTGRPRRVGWLDLVMLDYSNKLNGLTDLIITKLDILSGLKEIPVCIAYGHHEEKTVEFPTDLAVLERIEPLYITFSGWEEDITGIKKFKDLPKNAQSYVSFISGTLGVNISHVSVGPGRDQIIECLT